MSVFNLKISGYLLFGGVACPFSISYFNARPFIFNRENTIRQEGAFSEAHFGAFNFTTYGEDMGSF